MTDDINHITKKQISDIQKDRTYLVRYGSTTTLNLITVLTVTETSYQIRWNNNINNPITWEFKKRFHFDYTLVEDITGVDYDKSIQYNISTTPIEFPAYKFPTYKYKSCPSCNGTGYVSDSSTTAGIKTCPHCMGNKFVLDTIET